MVSAKTLPGTRHNNDLRESIANTWLSEPETVLPDYNIKALGDDCYSIVKFHRSSCLSSMKVKQEEKHNDVKMDNSFSRARSMILQYGLCNEWEYFITLTLDKTKYDRFNLGVFKDDLMQWIRDQRKKYQGSLGYIDKLSVLLVPEMHHDGAWHMHGLLHGIEKPILEAFERGKVPDVLVNRGYLNWPDYQEKFGFCSCGRIRDKTSAVLYAVKYIDKSLDGLKTLKGKHLYTASRPLKSASLVGSVYGTYPELDDLLSYHGKFCSTGLVTGRDFTWPDEFSPEYEMLKPFICGEMDDIDNYICPPEVFENMKMW